jgi:Leu/Phe-tRNA-protein transferase
MKFVIGLAIVLSAFFGPLSAWAKDEAQENLQRELCEGMLGRTLTSNVPNLQFDLIQGIGARGFLGSYPEVTIENMEAAAAQGVMFWGHSIGVQKSVMAAANHDATFKGLSKILYFVSDVDVSDLKDESDEAMVQARFSQVFAKADLIYFDEVGGQQVVKSIPKEIARRLIHPKKIGWFSKDDRGPRFSQGGWVFPKIRGILTYDAVFKSGSGTIKNILKLARSIETKGYTITFNGDFQQSLDKARDQVRIEQMPEGKLKAIPDGSRYRKAEDYQLAQALYKKGNAVSVEVRDSSGRLVAGVLGQFNGNVWAFETIFYDFTTRDGSRILTSKELEEMPDAREAKSLIDYAKVAVLAGLLRIHDHGIDVSDAGMVTKFTAGLKGFYVPAEEFLKLTGELKNRPQINVDLTTPFSFASRPE